MALDTSQHWIDEVKSAFDAPTLNRAQIDHVDLGPLKAWGRPINYDHRDRFADYTDGLWRLDVKPDTVLIDGRFRVCCFLTTLKMAAPGTRVIFDDYTDRPHYHIIENFAPRSEECGRQCLFIVPSRDQLDLAAIDVEIDNFRHVMD